MALKEGTYNLHRKLHLLQCHHGHMNKIQVLDNLTALIAKGITLPLSPHPTLLTLKLLPSWVPHLLLITFFIYLFQKSVREGKSANLLCGFPIQQPCDAIPEAGIILETTFFADHENCNPSQSEAHLCNGSMQLLDRKTMGQIGQLSFPKKTFGK